jgi:hypothetical protein
MKAKLEARFAALPRTQIEPQHILQLADVSAEDLGHLLKDWKRFTPGGLETLEALAGVAAPNREALRFRQAEHYLTGIDQQSAITFVKPEVGFVIAGDDSSALWAVKPDGEGEVAVAKLRKDDGELPGLEGANYNPRTDKVRVLSEDKSKVWELGFKTKGGELRLGDLEEVGKIESVGRNKNKGYEGLETLPAAVSPDGREYQLAVNEGRPRKVVFVDPDTLQVEGTADIPESVRDLLPDISDTAVSKRGTLVLLSDEGNAFVEFAIRKIDRNVGPGLPLPTWTLVPLGEHRIDLDRLPLDGAQRLQAEGSSFDDRGDLWIACEANSILIRFALEG